MDETKNVSEENKRELNKLEKREYYIKAKEIIRNAKIAKYIEESNTLSEKNMTFIGLFNGKNNLQYEKLRNIKLKIELAQTEKYNVTKDITILDILVEMTTCALCELNGNFDEKMQDLYLNLKENYCEKNITDEKIKILSYQKIAHSNQTTLPIIHKENIHGIFGDIKNQIRFYKIENKKLEDLIIEEREKMQIDTFSGKIIPKLISNNLKLHQVEE